VPLRFREEVQKVSRKGVKKPERVFSKRERVLETLAGKKVDRRPFTFWYPFGLSHMKAESLAAAALSFAAAYGVDLLRLPVVRDLPYPEQSSIDRPHDLTQLEELSGLAGFWGERFEALKTIHHMAEHRIAVFECIPDPLTALSYLASPELLSQTEKNHSSFLDKGLESVTAGLKNYLLHLFKAKCIDGLVIEIESATFEHREPEAFEAVVKPHLRNLLNFVTQESEVPIWLHVKGTRVYLKPLLDLPHQMISWPHLSSGPKLQRAFPKGYKGVIAGGIDEQALRNMSYQDIRRHVEEARNHRVSVLCIGDQLSSDVSPRRLKALSNFLQKRDWDPDRKEDDLTAGPD
jgi:uroporphyrinogen-III decarboxylase